ncbi:MAG: lysophospholipid acyltransferase family protein [Novosphingobium sp.]
MLSREVKGLMLWLFRRRGWRLEGEAPASPRFVIIGAPHTSNWDFVFFLGATHAFGLEPSFMGKASLFRWPLRHFMYDMGGVPVVRSAKGNYAEAMVSAFAANEKFALVIAPEGTRSKVPQWRSGFYHIAHGAGVPIVCAWVDNGTMRGGLGLEIMPSGDFAADMTKIAAFYREVMPGHPKWAAFEAMPPA